MDEFNIRFMVAMEISGKRPVDVADYCGIPKSTISCYMSGRMKPKAKRLSEIAKYLNVQETWLIGYDVEMSRSVAERERKMKIEVENMFYELTAEQQEKVYTLMKTMAEQNNRKKEA